MLRLDSQDSSRGLAGRARSGLCRARGIVLLPDSVFALSPNGPLAEDSEVSRSSHSHAVNLVCSKHNIMSPPSPVLSNFPQPSSKVTRSSEDFSANVSAWEEVLKKYSRALKLVSSEGSDSSISKHTERGQLLGVYVCPPSSWKGPHESLNSSACS